jgi:hypothetical protein
LDQICCKKVARKIKEDRGRRKSGLSKTHWRTYFGLCWEWQLATGKHKETNNDRISSRNIWEFFVMGKRLAQSGWNTLK